MKLKVYNIVTLQAVLYANENWVLQKKHDCKIIAIEMKHFRKIADKTKWDRRWNERIKKLVD